jgi:hypothetical protein
MDEESKIHNTILEKHTLIQQHLEQLVGKVSPPVANEPPAVPKVDVVVPMVDEASVAQPSFERNLELV